MGIPYEVNGRPDKVYELPACLDEISGFYQTTKDHFVCVQDELRAIFEIKGEKIVKCYSSTKTGDSEDIVVINDTAYILDAKHRAIYEFNDFRNTMKNPTKHDLNLEEGYDPEGMCYDETQDVLLIACKGNPKKDDAKRNVYTFSLETKTRSKKPYFIIDPDKFKLRKKGSKKTFNPSGIAIAIHKEKRDIYVIGTSELKMIIRLSKKGKNIRGKKKLDPEQYRQPEGITFLEDGTLYISSERKKDVKKLKPWKNAKIYKFNP